MFEDLADLFEQGAADGTPIREIVGEDPVEFAETFSQNYADGSVDQQGAGAADRRHRPRRRRGRGTGMEPMTTTALGSGDPGAGPGEVVQEAAGAARRGLRRGAGQHLRPARLERRGQDHGREDPVHAAQGRRGHRQRQRLRRRHAGGGRAGVDQPDRPVRRRRRNPHRPGEPRAGRPAAAPEGPGRDRGRPARAIRAHRCGQRGRCRPTRVACAAGSTSP